MANTTMEKMKKLIEEKKNKSAQQGMGTEKLNNKALHSKDVFKNTKRGGALNK